MQDKSCVFSEVSNMAILIPVMFKTESSKFLMWHNDLHCYIWWQYTHKDVLDKQCYELVIQKIHIKIWHSETAWEWSRYTHNINQVQYKEKGSTLTHVLKTHRLSKAETGILMEKSHIYIFKQAAQMFKMRFSLSLPFLIQLLFLVGWDSVSWYCGHYWPIIPAPDDSDGDCGEIGGMKIGRGNRSFQRKLAPAPLCPPQIPHN
jgi:hypothetical protein